MLMLAMLIFVCCCFFMIKTGVAGMKAFFHRKAEGTVDQTATNEQKVRFSPDIIINNNNNKLTQ